MSTSFELARSISWSLVSSLLDLSPEISSVKMLWDLDDVALTFVFDVTRWRLAL